MADTLRKGGSGQSPATPVKGGGGNSDRTDPELMAPPAALAAPTLAPQPMAPLPRPQAPMPQVATQIVGMGGMGNTSATEIPRTLHEDPTSMRPAVRPGVTGTQRAVAGHAGQTMRAEPSVLVEAERPKVWVATHKAPPDPDPRLILVREPDSPRAASFRVMRHRIAEKGDPRVIAVTSPGARDGKTTLAANLALALSEFGRAKVLLLEANLRSPQIAVLFGFLPPECFSVQLQRHRERPLDPWSIVEAFSPALHVLAVKPGETNRPLLDAPAFSIAIEMLSRVGYDYIVVDTPPVLGIADVNLIEDYVDAVILTSRSGRTMGRALRSAVEQLSPRKLLGVTLLDA